MTDRMFAHFSSDDLGNERIIDLPRKHIDSLSHYGTCGFRVVVAIIGGHERSLTASESRELWISFFDQTKSSISFGPVRKRSKKEHVTYQLLGNGSPEWIRQRFSFFRRVWQFYKTFDFSNFSVRANETFRSTYRQLFISKIRMNRPRYRRNT